MAIPHIIHYCWFGGGSLPPLAERCIASWRRNMPGWEIRRWDETNFDVRCLPYCAEAYEQRRYAFVSDYARFCVLYRYGGVYFDTDVELLRSVADLAERGPFFGFETDPDGHNSPDRCPPRYSFTVAPGLGFAMPKGHPLMLSMMCRYAAMHFGGTGDLTIVTHITRELWRQGLRRANGVYQVGDITVYTSEYFAPINVVTGRLHITPRTRSIHHYMASWTDRPATAKARLRHLLPEWLLILINKVKRRYASLKSCR